MSCGVTFYIGDFGKKLGVDFIQVGCGATPAPLDISDNDYMAVTFRKPSGATLTVIAAFADFPDSDGTPAAGDGTDGRIMISITDASFFDEAGTWEFQGVASLTSTYSHTSAVGTFEVSARLV